MANFQQNQAAQAAQAAQAHPFQFTIGMGPTNLPPLPPSPPLTDAEWARALQGARVPTALAVATVSTIPADLLWEFSKHQLSRFNEFLFIPDQQYQQLLAFARGPYLVIVLKNYWS
jgi:hypothetical protein